jgi:2-methylcitrate dehydratase PrpD
MDAIDLFVDTFTRIRFEDLPEKAVKAAKQEVLDSLATALGGSTKAAIRELVELAKEWGGHPQSTVFGYGFRCPAPHAALVNGTMAHALDYDDGHQAAQVHIGCVAVPVCLATAEMKTGVSGREFITALALGQDFLARLALADSIRLAPDAAVRLSRRGGDGRKAFATGTGETTECYRHCLPSVFG